MIITLMMILIEKYNTPENRSRHRTIKSIKKEIIGEYETVNIPRQGDIIKFNSVNYRVAEVIRVILSHEEKIVLQVIPHSTSRVKSSGSDSWGESIPLVVDIE